jgi:hypothetical protein
MSVERLEKVEELESRTSRSRVEYEVPNWARELLCLTDEQAALYMDQVPAFLGCDGEQGERIVKYLYREGWVDYGRIVVGEPFVIWLTSRGHLVSGREHGEGKPRVGALARIRAVNEVRIEIERRVPEATWICSKQAFREQGLRGARPNGVVVMPHERHAIVVKHGIPHEMRRERRIVEEHIGRFDGVAYFTDGAARALLERLKVAYEWNTVQIRSIPRRPM